MESRERMAILVSEMAKAHYVVGVERPMLVSFLDLQKIMTLRYFGVCPTCLNTIRYWFTHMTFIYVYFPKHVTDDKFHLL